MITTKMFNGTEDLTDAWEIRRKVFVEEQNVPIQIERDEYDNSSVHVVIYEDGSALATGRLVYKNGEYSVGRVAVLKNHRDRNYGTLVVKELINRAFLHGASQVRVHAQSSAQGFYEKLGFKCYGNLFLEAGIEHIRMMKKTAF